jgi:hypothetical protein
MRPQEFVEKLATLNPPILVARHPEAERFEDALVSLVVNFDMDEIYLGDIHFGEEAYEDETTFEVGMFEEKFLIVDKETGEVRVEDDDEEGTIMFSCAASSEKFLDAVWIGIQYLSRKVNETLKDTDVETCYQKAMECAEAAGSEDYFPFYQDLLDCYE